MICKNCQSEIPAKIKGRGPKPKDYCNQKCQDGFYAKARREGRRVLDRRAKKRKKPLFEIEILKPENQAKVAEILAWAEAQHPATPEAWGLKVARGEAA